MKKRLLALMLSLAAVLSLAACSSGGGGGGTAATPTPAPAATPAPAQTSQPSADANGFRAMEEMNLSMAVGGTGGGWYIMGAGLNEGFESSLPVHMTLIPGGGSTNPILVNEGAEVQLGFTYIADAQAAHDGTFAYEGQTCENLSGLCSLGIVQYLHILTTPDSGFNSLQDMVDNPAKLKIAVGPRGGGNEIMLNRLLEQYGTSLDDLSAKGASVQYISPTEGMTAIKDGQINAVNYCAAAPLASLVETLASMELKFVSVDKDIAEATCDKYGYTYQACPAGTYSYQEEDYYTIADTVVIVVNNSIPEDVVYNLTKIICENRDRWLAVHASFEAFDPETASVTGIELHPGARAYYEEANLLK